MCSRYEHKIKTIFLCYTDVSIFLIRIGDIFSYLFFSFVFLFSNAGIAMNGFYFSIIPMQQEFEDFSLLVIFLYVLYIGISDFLLEGNGNKQYVR